MDIKKIRHETLGCRNKLFFDSAGSSLPPKIVNETVKTYLDQEEEIGGYRMADDNEKILSGFYTEVAQLLNTKSNNIAFTYNATDSYARALSSLHFKKGQTIITSNDDYISNQIQFLSLQKRFGIQIERIRNKDNGDIELDHLEELIKKTDPILVAITHIPTGAGQIQDVEAIGKICANHHCYFLLDACQSVGQIPIDVQAIQCDFLSATGRKFLRGPRGTGFLYISDRILNEKLEPLFIDMRGGDWTDDNEYKLYDGARRFEMWEFPYASMLGLKEAIRYANNLGMDSIHNYNKTLFTHLRLSLNNINKVRVLDHGSKLGNIVTFHKEDTSLESMITHLKKNNIYFSVSQKIYNQIDYKRKGVDWAIRLSPHYFNTTEELTLLTEIIST